MLIGDKKWIPVKQLPSDFTCFPFMMKREVVYYLTSLQLASLIKSSHVPFYLGQQLFIVLGVFYCHNFFLFINEKWQNNVIEVQSSQANAFIFLLKQINRLIHISCPSEVKLEKNSSLRLIALKNTKISCN